MPYNTKTIKRDSQNIPVPQIFNPSIDDFSALTGVDLGGGRVGADNLMWGKTAGGLYVPVKVSDAGAVATELTGSIETVNSAPVVGVKTITATAAEIFAGASVKANRRKIIVKNEDPVLRFRIGPLSITQQTGFPVEPGATIEFQFDPVVAVPIYAISEGASLNVAVMEI